MKDRYERNLKKVIDKYVPLMYNNTCVTESDKNILAEWKFGLRRNTQEAEEAPLLRV